MRMEIVTAMLCTHMLLWAVCMAAPSTHTLMSNDETLLRRAQPGKISWRKLLQENTSLAETTHASIKTESNNVSTNDARTQNADVIKDVAIDVKIETPNSDSAHQEEVKSESMLLPQTLPTEDNSTKKEEVKSQEASKEEEPTGSNVTELQASTTEMKEIEKVENSTTEAIAELQVEEHPNPSTKEDGANASEQGVKTEENAQQASPQDVTDQNSRQTEEKQDPIALVEEAAPESKTEVEESKEVLDVDVQSKPQGDSKEELVVEDKKDSVPAQSDATPGEEKALGDDQQDTSTKETSAVIESSEIKVENKNDSMPDQKDAVPGDDKTLVEDQHDTSTGQGMGTVIESVETKEEPTEGNPRSMADTESGEKKTDFDDNANIKMVQSSEPEGDNKRLIALDLPVRVEEQASSNHTDSSKGEVSTPGDAKVENERIEEKNEASDGNAEIEKKTIEENNTVEVSQQEKSDERGEEKQDSSDANTQPEDEESEKQKAEEVPQEKSEEKAEENHEPSVEIAAENHEPTTEDNAEVKDKDEESNVNAEEVSLAKTDEETQAVANEVESQLEALKRDTVFDTTNDQRQETDPSDDEYNIIQELAELPTKFHETAGKVADHLRPDLRRWTDTSKEYFNRANQQISESFSPLIGKQYAPFFASMISYGILLLPLLVVILLFDHIKALFSLQKVLLFINIYLAAYFATLWLASFILGLEPMSFFYHNSLSSYLSLQLLQALGYVVYLILQTANMINSCSLETRVGKITSGMQWAVALGIGLHYYVTVFHPAVASKPPHTSWKFYAIYSAAFLVLCLFARIRWVKKQYVGAGNGMANKKS